MKYFPIAIVCCIAAMAGSYYISGQVPQRKLSAGELEWVATCTVLSGMGVDGCRDECDELFRLGYFDQVEDVGIIQQ